jgi:recombination protein RecT
VEESGRAVTTKALKPIEALRATINRMEPEFKSALPPHIPAEKFIRVVMTAIQGNLELLNADRHSLIRACTMAAQDGLLPDGREAALVIYNLKGVPTVRYTPMIGGVLKKVRNSGELASIDSHVVYADDEFDFYVDENGEHVRFRPALEDDRGERRLAFAVARTKDGGFYIEVMTAAQVLAVKDVSRAKNAGPWASEFEDEMWRKTVIRRLSKRLPMSTDLDTVIRRDDDLYDLSGKDAPANEAPKGPARLAKIIESQKEPPAPPQPEQEPEGMEVAQ